MDGAQERIGWPILQLIDSYCILLRLSRRCYTVLMRPKIILQNGHLYADSAKLCVSMSA